MKFLSIIYFSLLLFGCNVFNSENNSNKLVPDNTPFIASTLEVTEDTVHHYPEVYVGRVKFKAGYYDDRLCCQVIPGIWWPTLNAQVNKTARRMSLIRTNIDDANVTITGPLNSEKKKSVTFKSEGQGVYGDQNYELELIENGRYRLDVTMADGSHYRAFTTLPELANWPVPDTIKPELELDTIRGNLFEQTPDAKDVRLYYDEAPHAVLTVGKINQSDDREVFSLSEDENFLHSDKGNYLRGGSTYMIRNNEGSLFADSTFFGPIWQESSQKSLKISVDVWMYLRQHNADLSTRWFYQPIFSTIGVNSDNLWSKMEQEQVDAFFSRDSDYLFEISNILKVGESGKVLPEAESDAIGVFGGFSSVYRKTVMKPRRSWEPDSLGWGPEN